jgi:hypothetical protein
LEDLGIGRRILKWIFKKENNVTEVREKWWAFVNREMNLFGLHKLRGNSWVVEEGLGFTEGLCSMELILRNIQTVDCSEDSEGRKWTVGRDVR